MKGTEKIEYTFNSDGFCKTECNYRRGYKIGSVGCQQCDYCVSHNLEQSYVLCGFIGGIKKKNKPIKIYIAGALFSIAEIKFNEMLAIRLSSIIPNILIHLPQVECKGMEFPTEIYHNCKDGVDDCDVIVAVLDGTDVDSGTAWEIGYGVAKGKKVIGIRTDFRNRGDDGALNLMLSKSLTHLIQSDDITEIVEEIKTIITE